MQQAQQIAFTDEDFSLLESQRDVNRAYKVVDIDTKAEKWFQAEAPKIPLLPNPFDRELTAMYYENAAYETVYKRSRFRNSQDLIFHNLKVRGDPLLTRQQADQQARATDQPPLYRDVYNLLSDPTEPVSLALSQADIAS